VTKQEEFEAILEFYSAKIDTIKIYLLDGPGASGRVLKSKNKFYVTTSSSCLRIHLEEIKKINDKDGNEISVGVDDSDEEELEEVELNE